MVVINFDADTILPNLNPETCMTYGIDDKPVLLKKTILDKNTRRHPEIPAHFFADIIGHALYAPDAVVKGHDVKPCRSTKKERVGWGSQNHTPSHAPGLEASPGYYSFLLLYADYSIRTQKCTSLRSA